MLTIENYIIQYIAGGLIYVVGAVIYMTKIPERCKPGAFDIIGQSH